jgi:hypothetical protein
MNQLTRTLSILIFTGICLFSFACKKKEEGKLLVYPNPATTYIVFDATGSPQGEITIKDMIGTTIKTFNTKDSSRIQWRIDTVSRGIYNYWYKADGMKTKTGKIQFNEP